MKPISKFTGKDCLRWLSDRAYNDGIALGLYGPICYPIEITLGTGETGYFGIKGGAA